jgi:hypothetical protein
MVPLDAAQQVPIVRSQRNQIAATAMIGTEDQPLYGQLIERHPDVACGKARAIGSDKNNFIVAELSDLFHRSLEALGKSRAMLLVPLKTGRPR